MASIGRGLGLGLVILAGMQVSASAASNQPTAKPPRHQPAATAPASKAVPAPKELSDTLDALGKGFDGMVGIAVRSIDDGWETGWKDHDLYPQQSVSKLWVSLTALDAVDRGRVSLDQKVTLTKSD